jgi:hypothetical protein
LVSASDPVPAITPLKTTLFACVSIVPPPPPLEIVMVRPEPIVKPDVAWSVPPLSVIPLDAPPNAPSAPA